MGYSLTVTMKSQKAKAKMLAFLEKHFRTATQIHPGLMSFTRGDRTYTARDCSETMGDNEGLKLGFGKGGGHDFSQHYTYCILNWIALRAGKRRTYAKRIGVKEAVPYWVFDHGEGSPVLIRSEWEGRISLEKPPLNATVVEDEHGFYPIEDGYNPDYPEKFRKNWPEINTTVHAELKRLSNLWDPS